MDYNCSHNQRTGQACHRVRYECGETFGEIIFTFAWPPQEAHLPNIRQPMATRKSHSEICGHSTSLVQLKTPTVLNNHIFNGHRLNCPSSKNSFLSTSCWCCIGKVSSVVIIIFKKSHTHLLTVTCLPIIRCLPHVSTHLRVIVPSSGSQWAPSPVYTGLWLVTILASDWLIPTGHWPPGHWSMSELPKLQELVGVSQAHHAQCSLSGQPGLPVTSHNPRVWPNSSSTQNTGFLI